MSFEELVEAIDERLRAAVPTRYGLYRGPHVAYWHFGDRSVRLRAGTNGDVLLDGALEEPLHVPCDQSALGDLVAALTRVETAWRGFLRPAEISTKSL